MKTVIVGDLAMWISKLIVFVVFSALIFFSCKKEEIPFSTGRPDAKTWLVPKDEIIDAGVGKDGIPSVDAPNFTSAAEINNHFNDDLVLGFVHQQEAKAFPLDMLNWHEIINDKIGNLPMAITYCPLTGTGLGWGRSINGAVTTFGVSGLLYNNNLMPYDRSWFRMPNTLSFAGRRSSFLLSGKNNRSWLVR